MEIYQTEEQQVDAIKTFWKANGNSIIAGLVIGFSAFIGYGFYTENKAEQEQLTADSYQTLVDGFAANNADVAGKAQQFIKENPASSYASLTALSLAKQAADNKNWEQTATYLQQAIDTAPVEAIKAVAITRLARVQIQLEQIDQALTTLEQPVPEAFNAIVDEIKGDAYLLQGKKDLARNAYQVALAASTGSTNSVLQMKLDDLAQVAPMNSVSDLDAKPE